MPSDLSEDICYCSILRQESILDFKSSVKFTGRLRIMAGSTRGEVKSAKELFCDPKNASLQLNPGKENSISALPTELHYRQQPYRIIGKEVLLDLKKWNHPIGTSK